jgi:uncharacterized protein DUF6302
VILEVVEMSDERKPEKKPSAMEVAYWERLAEPELAARGVLLDVEANEEPFAVPVGRLRRGGHIEFLKKREAEKGFKQLSDKDGFPNLRLISCRDPLTGKPMRYYELRWGEPAPFNGCDWCEPICALLLGVHYGYSADSITRHVEARQKNPRRALDGRTIQRLIESVRNPE